jgi:hypothetical protein
MSSELSDIIKLLPYAYTDNTISLVGNDEGVNPYFRLALGSRDSRRLGQHEDQQRRHDHRG